jgi:hypothetical protein
MFQAIDSRNSYNAILLGNNDATNYLLGRIIIGNYQRESLATDIIKIQQSNLRHRM